MSETIGGPSDFTGGSQGLSARFAQAPEGSGLFDDQWVLYVVLIIGGIVFLLTRSLVRGKYGRAFAIVKGNENVASSMGISPYRYKVLAFTIASLIGGVSGFLYMVVIAYTSPETMSFGHSIQLVAAMVIGGAASIVGSVLGGLVSWGIWGADDGRFHPAGLLLSILGAIIVLWIWRMMKSRSTV